MVGDVVNDLCINDDRVKDKQVRDEFPNLFATEQHRESPLLVEWDTELSKANS